jgi:membrane fusion protein (multidrug efflux system)
MRRKMKSKNLLFFLAVIVSFVACSDEKPEFQPPEVEVYVTNEKDVPIYENFVGTVAGQKDIEIRARVTGFLEGIHFKEGSVVKKGQLLYTIESQQYEAETAAYLSKLAEAKTNLAHAESELARIEPLAKANAVSQSDLDAARAAYEAAKAMVRAAEANLRASRIRLSYTRVKAPITGIIGKTRAKVGDFVGQSPNPVILNVISKNDTVLVDFYLAENDYLRIFKELEKRDKKDGIGRSENIELILSDGSVFPYKGKINFIDRGIDVSTGAILIQVIFPNPTFILRPGLFAKVHVPVDMVKNAILIPQRCVSELQGEFSVMVVNDSNKVEHRKVTLGETVGSFWLVKEGLKPNEKVVYEGLQKVRDGMEVNPVIAEIKTNSKEEIEN